MKNERSVQQFDSRGSAGRFAGSSQKSLCKNCKDIPKGMQCYSVAQIELDHGKRAFRCVCRGFVVSVNRSASIGCAIFRFYALSRYAVALLNVGMITRAARTLTGRLPGSTAVYATLWRLPHMGHFNIFIVSSVWDFLYTCQRHVPTLVDAPLTRHFSGRFCGVGGGRRVLLW